jgi:hypothetical protein
VFQAGTLITTVSITKFALTDIRRRQELRRQAEVDLTLSVEGTAGRYELRGDSPQGRENLADRLFGTLQMPAGDVLERVFKTIEDLYRGDNPDAVERALKIIGAEVSMCLPKDLLDRLSSGRVRTMFVRHEVGNLFPFELALLNDNKEEYFLADRIVICRWLRNIDNAPTSDTKQVRQAAVMRGDVDIASAETKLLRMVCKGAKDFQSPEEVRNKVFSNRGFELLHFIGHCLEEESGTYLELAKGPLAMREIGALRSESVFGEAAPVVVINGCGTARSIPSLFGPDSFSARFLKAKASAFVGTLWPVEERLAHDFSRAFYANLAAGHGVGEAMLETKLNLTSANAKSGRRLTAAQETWRRIALRGYCVFAHPEMKVTFSTAA